MDSIGVRGALPLRFYEVVSPGYTVAKAIRLLGTRGVDHAAVVDDEGYLVAVVSTKDLARHVLDAFEEAGAVERFDFDAVLEVPVSEVASKPPYVTRSLDMLGCAEIMLDRGIGFLPVVDDSGRLVAACTELDYALELLGEEGEARCYATHRLLMGEPDEPLIEALGTMMELGVRRLPIRFRDDYYMATMAELLMAIARERREETLVRDVVEVAQPAPRLGYEEATIGQAAELVLAAPERALLLIDREGLARGIVTERDLLEAYRDIRRGERGCPRLRRG
ncbi:MAG: CBS domain-containing protein [Crenarchaeota archaeon]|nr:CBS domain-containing protein [Thermoproteota archaeon]